MSKLFMGKSFLGKSGPSTEELLNRYLQAVRFWLPRTQQQDIIAELSLDLHSQIEDKETELGRPVDEAELEAILRKCGSPILVASRYRRQTQLIGPALFPIYQFVLKVVLLWILVPVFVVIIGPAIILPATHRWEALLQTWSTFWFALFVAAGIITVIFAILERSEDQFKFFEKWELRSLPPAPKLEQATSRTQTVFELVLGIIGLSWLLAIPQYPFLILGPASALLKPAPMWHSFYLPMILLSVAGLAHQCVSLLRPRWIWLPPTARLLTTVLYLVLVNYMLDAASHAPSGEWHPFVVLANSVPASGQEIRLLAIVNASILISLIAAWCGCCIAGLVQAWQLLRTLRRRTSHAGDVAMLRML